MWTCMRTMNVNLSMTLNRMLKRKSDCSENYIEQGIKRFKCLIVKDVSSAIHTLWLVTIATKVLSKNHIHRRCWNVNMWEISKNPALRINTFLKFQFVSVSVMHIFVVDFLFSFFMIFWAFFYAHDRAVKALWQR